MMARAWWITESSAPVLGEMRDARRVVIFVFSSPNSFLQSLHTPHLPTLPTSTVYFESLPLRAGLTRQTFTYLQQKLSNRVGRVLLGLQLLRRRAGYVCFTLRQILEPHRIGQKHQRLCDPHLALLDIQRRSRTFPRKVAVGERSAHCVLHDSRSVSCWFAEFCYQRFHCAVEIIFRRRAL